MGREWLKRQLHRAGFPPLFPDSFREKACKQGPNGVDNFSFCPQKYKSRGVAQPG